MSSVYYTDGSCKANGKDNASGGFGVVKIDKDDNILWEYQSFKEPTTNNEMELMAILEALNHIKDTEDSNFLKPIIYSDSAYAVNLINNWMYSWERNGWTRPKNQPVKNLEIIKQIRTLAHLAEVRKVPGHSGIKWNEYVDFLATGKIKLLKEQEYETKDSITF